MGEVNEALRERISKLLARADRGVGVCDENPIV